MQGRINDPTAVDQGWTVEMALPWHGLAILFDGRRMPTLVEVARDDLVHKTPTLSPARRCGQLRA